MATPPAPPPLPPSFTKVCTDLAPPIPPVVAPNSSEASYSHLIELLTYSGAAFNDHWAYFVRRDAQHESVGVKIHATGDVRYGFRFEVKRSVDLTHSEEAPTKRIPLQWIEDAVLFDDAMWNDGVYMEDSKPACGLEAELSKVAPPGKSLTSIEEDVGGRRITQRDCQTWVVESANHLVDRGILKPEVAIYLAAIKQ